MIHHDVITSFHQLLTVQKPNVMLHSIDTMNRPNENTELKAKVDSDIVISTSFSQDILPFLRMTLCALVSSYFCMNV